MGRADGPLDRIAETLLRRIRFDRRDPAWKYLGEIERDQGAVLQLTPEGIDLFDAAVADSPGIDYGCVVAGVPKPREDFKLKELLDPEYVVLRALFRLHRHMRPPAVERVQHQVDHALQARPHARRLHYPTRLEHRWPPAFPSRTLAYTKRPIAA